ncbi:hypothetical protein AB0P21_32780 [Kribbella sp. NPDC056861]|uniref:hypothetical protein n=1 Tax=Kribbella sp. NPDC056861 TaxID=3154857 RepID=UPI00341CE9F1
MAELDRSHHREDVPDPRLERQPTEDSLREPRATERANDDDRSADRSATKDLRAQMLKDDTFARHAAGHELEHVHREVEKRSEDSAAKQSGSHPRENDQLEVSRFEVAGRHDVADRDVRMADDTVARLDLAGAEQASAIRSTDDSDQGASDQPGRPHLGRGHSLPNEVQEMRKAEVEGSSAIERPLGLDEARPATDDRRSDGAISVTSDELLKTDADDAPPADRTDPVDRDDKAEEDSVAPSAAEDEEGVAAADRQQEKPERADHETDSKGFSLDRQIGDERAKEVVDRWDPRRANLPVRPADHSQAAGDAPESDDQFVEMADQDAVEYIKANQEDRPWLAPAVTCDPKIQRIYVALDLGSGHSHYRHGAMGGDEIQKRRVAYLEDPAQLDPAKRERSIDGLKARQVHLCGVDTTRVHDATAFAVAFARAVEHPALRDVLDQAWDENERPDAVEIPITDLLGPDGHQYCSGYRLQGEWPESRAMRKEWVMARRQGLDLAGIPEPTAERIPSFEGGTFVFRFLSNSHSQSYEVATMFPQAPATKPEGVAENA